MSAPAFCRRYSFQVEGMTVELENPPAALGRGFARLEPTAAAWAAFARGRWGDRVRRFAVSWDENGRVRFRMEGDCVGSVRVVQRRKEDGHV